MKVHPSPQGQPAGQGMANLAWLGFCSGTYLKQPARQIPIPLGPSSQAFGYSDKTVVFHDSFGLPKRVKLFATDGQLVCDYEVLQTTNLLGNTLPIKFRMIQYGQPPNGSARMGSKTELLGKVISIQIGREPTLPFDVQKELNK